MDLPIPLKFIPTHPWASVLWSWIQSTRRLKKHNLNHIVSIRNTVYSILQRNLRWFDIHQIFLDLIIDHNAELGSELTKKLLSCLINSPNTATGHTLTSYRIPIAWETLFVSLYDILVGTL